MVSLGRVLEDALGRKSAGLSRLGNGHPEEEGESNAEISCNAMVRQSRQVPRPVRPRHLRRRASHCLRGIVRGNDIVVRSSNV